MSERVTILDGSTFVVSNRNGDIEPSATFPTGLFSSDTRFLSTWVLTVNGERLTPLSVDDLEYFESRFFLVPGQPTQYVDATVSIIRQRTLAGSFVEDLTIINHDVRPAALTVRLEVGSDFADIFEIKDVQQKARPTRVTVENGRLRLSYQRDTFRRDTIVSASATAQLDEQGLTFQIQIEPYNEWTAQLHVETLVHPPMPQFGASLQNYQAQIGVRKREQLDQWLAQAPRLVCDYGSLTETYRRSLVDVAALRYTLLGLPKHMPAAGLPSMALP
jgi:glycogen debranching enzyme